MESDEESEPATPTTPKDPINEYLNDISTKVTISFVIKIIFCS